MLTMFCFKFQDCLNNYSQKIILSSITIFHLFSINHKRMVMNSFPAYFTKSVIDTKLFQNNV